MAQFARLPKGVGSVTKVSGQKLRNPWRARKQVGTLDGKRVYRTVGYFATRKEALEALMEDGRPSVSKPVVTFAGLYEKWSAEKYKEVSDSLKKNYIRAFGRFALLHDRKFRDLKVSDYEAVITEDVPVAMRRICKILLSQLYKYALRHEYADKDYSALVDFKTAVQTPHKKVPFSVGEVNALWKMVGQETVDMVLVGIYSGLRPQELLTIDISAMRDGCFVGGIKTKNGKNRRVPIHPSILPIVQDYCRKSAKLGVKWLFPNAAGNPYDLPTWRRRRFDPLFPNHTPHEMRHSFATYARRSGMDRVIIKRIMGHALNDLTEDVYTHVDTDLLREEMAKFEIK